MNDGRAGEASGHRPERGDDPEVVSVSGVPERRHEPAPAVNLVLVGSPPWIARLEGTVGGERKEPVGPRRP